MADFQYLRPVIREGLAQIYAWYKSENSLWLKSLFPEIGFAPEHYKPKAAYIPPVPLSAEPLLPVMEPGSDFTQKRNQVREEIQKEHRGFSADYLNNLNLNQLYFLLEKYGSCIPAQEDGSVSLFDACKLRCAETVIRENAQKAGCPGNVNRLMLHFDISGIQGFIYNITSRGALKNLRARSFFIELLTYHTTERLLEAFNLHPANILVNGGGSVYLLAGRPDNYKLIIEEIDFALNSWLLEEFGVKLHVAFAVEECTEQELVSGPGTVLKRLAGKIFNSKQQKFHIHILKGCFPFLMEQDLHYYHCEICRKEAPYFVNEQAFIRVEGAEERFTCRFCHNLIRIGNILPDIRYIYAGDREPGESYLKIENTWYSLLTEPITSLPCRWILVEDTLSSEFFSSLPATGQVLFIKNHITRVGELPDELQSSLLNRDTEQFAVEEPLKKEYIAPLEALARAAGESSGAEYIGALCMDADNMGKLIQDGFSGRHTLLRMICFSRQIHRFFKVYVASRCREPAIQIIYAGGDDLFLLGAWNSVIDAALEIGKTFQAYTCSNLDLGLSGGLTVHHAKFPVNKMAELAKEALATAKANQKPCWMCRKDFHECPLFMNGSCLRKDSFAPFFTGWYANRKRQLEETTKHAQPRLQTALKWKDFDPKKEVFYSEVEEYLQKPYQDFKQFAQKTSRGFFHQVLDLLETWYSDGVLYLPRIVWVLQKFKRDLAKETSGESLNLLYDTHFHFFDPARFATLHLLLNWIILAKKKGGGNETTV